MAVPSTGAQHYTLLLIPGLLSEIERRGLRHVIAESSLDQHAITSLYFEVKSINQLLPDDPATIDPILWPDLQECAGLLSLLVRESAGGDLARAKKQAINRFLPQARKTLQGAYQEHLRHGRIDFRLASMVRQPASSDQAEQTCIEAMRLERQWRYRNMLALTTDGLDTHQAAIVDSAKAYVKYQMADPPDDFGAVDLLISLCDQLRLLLMLDDEEMPDEQALPGHITVSNVVMGMGNILFCDELGLTRQAPVTDRNITKTAHPLT